MVIAIISVLLEHTKLIYIASIVKKVVPTALDLIIVSYARQVSLTKMEHVSVHTINIYMMEIVYQNVLLDLNQIILQWPV